MEEEKGGSALLHQNNKDAKNTVPNEEIVASNPSHKSWKGILIAIFVILFISGIIVLAIYLTSPDPLLADLGQKFTFKDVFTSKDIRRPLLFQWVGVNKLNYVNESFSCKILDLTTMNETEIKLKAYLEEKKSSPATIDISPDQKYFKISYNLNANYRHSATAQYTALSMTDYQKRNDIGPKPDAALQNAVWSPKTHILTYAHENHLYIQSDPLDNTKIICITNGLDEAPYLTYGVADWLNEEEILKVSKAFWWSPNEKKIAFMSFNDVNVDDYKIKVYGEPTDLNGDYITVKYPKAGKSPPANNPKVDVFVYDYIEKGNAIKIEKPPEIANDYYVSMVKWIGDSYLLIGWLNREQNHSWLTISMNFGKLPTPDTWIIFEEKVKHGWLNMLKQTTEEPLISADQKKLYFMLDRITKGTEYRNIAELKLDYRKGMRARKKWVGVGDFDFSELLFLEDPDIFFTAPILNDPKQMHLYKVDKSGGEIICITCLENNPNCTYNSFSVNPFNKRHFIRSCLGPQVPQHKLMYRMDNGSLVYKKMLINNTQLLVMMVNKSMPIIRYEKVKIKINHTASIELEAKLWLPKQLNENHVIKFPLLLSVYAGPSSQSVTTKFAGLRWQTYLASSLGVIILEVDGRGTSLRGRAFERAVYKNLGNIEIHDQLMAAKAIAQKYKFINSSQVGAYGWSYGGFTVGHLLGHPDNDLIRCGISVAPVTNFEYYDSAYTERYLGLKQNDQIGIYKQTDIGARAKHFRNKEFLLVHGTKDDNVHFMNTASLIKTLVANEIMFDVMVYPDEAHTLMGGQTHIHVFRKMTSFLMNCFNRTSVNYKIPLFL